MGIVGNRASSSFHGGSLEIALTVPLTLPLTTISKLHTHPIDPLVKVNST